MSQAAQTVFGQIQTVLNDTSVTDKKAKIEEILKSTTNADAIEKELKSVLPFFGGHDGKPDFKGHSGAPFSTTTPSG